MGTALWSIPVSCSPPYEFSRQWRCVALLVPDHHSNRDRPKQTEWTEEGRRLICTHDYKNKKVPAQPGVHFKAVEPTSGDYFLFPEEAGNFRHAWALVRKRRPDVVVIENLPLPSVNRPSAYNSKYCSLFFRPWTLFAGDAICAI